jgi:hypothetical protein
MAYRFVAYIDESGDEGFVFPEGRPDRGSSRWFVISAVITPFERDKELIMLAKSIRSDLQMQPKASIHFADLRHDRRVYVVIRIANSWLTVASVIIHKTRIEHPEIFQAEAFRLYKYAARLLLERVSWFCRDTAASQEDCQCRLIFEHRKALSYEGLQEYLTILQGQAEDDAWQQLLLNDVRIHWPAIVIKKVEAAQKPQYAGLQFADCVASGTRAALEYRHGFTEHRYGKMLKPRIYERGTNYKSYGLKFFPGGIEATDERGHWLRKHFR